MKGANTQSLHIEVKHQFDWKYIYVLKRVCTNATCKLAGANKKKKEETQTKIKTNGFSCQAFNFV